METRLGPARNASVFVRIAVRPVMRQAGPSATTLMSTNPKKHALTTWTTIVMDKQTKAALIPTAVSQPTLTGTKIPTLVRQATLVSTNPPQAVAVIVRTNQHGFFSMLTLLMCLAIAARFLQRQ